jgi:ABC-type polysaccharide/polyol phosphate export permease
MARSSTSDVLKDLWTARYLLWQFTRRDLTVRYAQAVMGFLWALLMPILVVCSGLMFKLVVAVVSGEPVASSSTASLGVKALPWAFFSGSISLAVQSIVANSNLLGKVYFPRETLPLASVFAQSVDSLVGCAVLAIALPVLGVWPSLSWLWVPFVAALLLTFTVGVSLLLSCANLFYRDVKYIVQVILSFGVFATPVFFDPQLLGPQAASVLMALPLSPFIQAFDVVVVQKYSLFQIVERASPRGTVIVWAPWMLGYAITLSMLCFFTGVRLFRRASARFAELA